MTVFMIYMLGYLPTYHWFLRSERQKFKKLEAFDFFIFFFVSIIWPYWVMHRGIQLGWAKVDPGPIAMGRCADTLFPPIKPIEKRRDKQKRLEREEAERMTAIRRAINKRERELGFPETVDF